MLDRMEYHNTYSQEIEGIENYSSTPSPSSSSAMRTSSSSKYKKNRNNSNNTRRFSDEQIKSLESMFESETRLEPRKKLQLAKELGLQPRQVAIWFQNKRARWKSKQLERDFSILRNNYNNLASRFESLKKEKQALLIQLQKLNEVMQKPLEQAQSSTQAINKASNSMDSESENGDTTKSEPEMKPRSPSSAQRSEHVLGCGVLSDDDTCIKVEYFENMGEDEPSLLNFGGDGSMTSPEDWRGTFESDHSHHDLLGQSSSDYQWWDFWS